MHLPLNFEGWTEGRGESSKQRERGGVGVEEEEGYCESFPHGGGRKGKETIEAHPPYPTGVFQVKVFRVRSPLVSRPMTKERRQ